MVKGDSDVSSHQPVSTSSILLRHNFSRKFTHLVPGRRLVLQRCLLNESRVRSFMSVLNDPEHFWCRGATGGTLDQRRCGCGFRFGPCGPGFARLLLLAVGSPLVGLVCAEC